MSCDALRCTGQPIGSLPTMTTIELTSVQSIFNFAIPLSEGGPDSLSANTSLLGLHKYDTHAVQVEDVRSRETGFSLDEQGFEFHKAPTSFQDFADDDAIRSAYYREVEQLAKRMYASEFMINVEAIVLTAPIAPAQTVRTPSVTLSGRHPVPAGRPLKARVLALLV